MTSEPRPAPLKDFPNVITLPVQWGDQDAFGHVNNVVYFRWFESSRIAYMNAVGLGVLLETDGVGPILAAIGCDYQRQLSFPDTVHVGARVTRIGHSSIGIEHQVLSDSQAAIVAKGQSTLVVFDYRSQEPVAVPTRVREAIQNIQGRKF